MGFDGYWEFLETIAFDDFWAALPRVHQSVSFQIIRVLTIQKEKDSNRHQKQNIITLQENKQLEFWLLGKKGISFRYLTEML